jgi:hypothetical protein
VVYGVVSWGSRVSWSGRRHEPDLAFGSVSVPIVYHLCDHNNISNTSLFPGFCSFRSQNSSNRSARSLKAIKMSTLTTFHLFPLLPSELRIKVYNFALYNPRTIRVASKLIEKGRKPLFETSFISQDGVPALLHTSRESRLEGMRIYQRIHNNDNSPKYTYVSFEQDTLACTEDKLHKFPEEVVRHVSKVIVRVSDPAYFWQWYEESLLRMDKLKHVDFFAPVEEISWYPGRTHLDGMINNINLAREANPDWVCPRMRFLDMFSGHEVSVIARGVWSKPIEVKEIHEEVDLEIS